jgi:predicted membrane protein
MEKDEKDLQQPGVTKNSRMWSGLILVIAGVLLLAYKMGAGIPGWIFTWPVLLIVIGVLIGIKSRFHNPGAFILIIIGGVNLIDRANPELNFHNYIIPAILIGAGLIFIFRPRRSWGGFPKSDWRRMRYHHPSPASQGPLNYMGTKNNMQEDNGEYVEINTAFGSVKKIILSKNFKGGEINNFMGGTEINFMQADIQHPVVLEVNNVFGGAKLIVPSNWNVKNEVTAVFGGIEDKRTINPVPDPEKIMVLNGTCVFGGIEVTNY